MNQPPQELQLGDDDVRAAQMVSAKRRTHWSRHDVCAPPEAEKQALRREGERLLLRAVLLRQRA